MTTFTLTDSTGSVYTLSMPYWDAEKRRVTKNVNAFDFWDNTFEVVDKGKDDEPLTLSGYESSMVTEEIVTGYFDSYDEGETWTADPQKMTDGDATTWAWSQTINDSELLLTHSILSSYGKISKVEIRFRKYKTFATTYSTVRLVPIFANGNGDNHDTTFNNIAFDYSPWIDITNDTNAPNWSPKDLSELSCRVILSDTNSGHPNGTVLISIVEIRVTYISFTNTKIEAVDSLADYNREVTIAGLGDCYDGVYVMTSFSYKTMKGTNAGLEWEMELQYVRD